MPSTSLTRYLAVFFLGFSSGLPLLLTSSTLQAWFTVSQLPLAAISLLGLVGQPYVFKFFWAPFFDRFQPPLLDFRRGWICILQLILILCLLSMGMLDPHHQPWLLSGLALITAFFSASQDIVIDAYRTDILPPQERGLGAALFTGGYRLAMLVSGGIALISADYYGWQFTYNLMAGFIALSLIITFTAPAVAAIGGRPHTLREALIEPLREFYQRDNIGLILLFVLVFKLGDQAIQLMSNPFLLRGLGFSLTEVGIANKTVGFAATIVGVFLGGVLLTRISLYRALFSFGVLQACSNAAYFGLAIVGKNYYWMWSVVTLENLASGMTAAAMTTFFMGLCDHRYTATQFAILTAIYAIERVYIAPLIGMTVEYSSWPVFFLNTVILAVIGLVLLAYLQRQHNKAFTFA